jgi:glucose-1-phosphate cytidylyltransferase
MQVVILAGGYGQRFNDSTSKIPKPLIKVNKIPIIFYVMELYSKYKFNNFIICTGYKSEEFFKFFNKFIIRKENNFLKIKYKKKIWNIKILYTGLSTNTGGRIRKISKYLKKDTAENFFVSYGDCISNINIAKEYKFHQNHKKLATIAAVTTPSRFGVMKISKNIVLKFKEKPNQNDNWINGGFFIFSKRCLNLFKSNKSILEKEPITSLIKLKNLKAFKHKGLWQPIDNVKDKNYIENLLKLKKTI